ncbi:TonB-dependent receptor plug domain-containing protein [Rubrivirga sp.]|uniref:TonB-dependent receptor plug domain-containing protein n=1 Tax=Rubrivirga sp. TaxID=1885344 RepID=UPI003B523BFC
MRSVLVLAVVIATGCGSGNGVREASDPNVLEGEDLQRRDLQRIEDMLRGQMAGVQVREVGGDLVIRIRGAESFGQSNADPLFVIDGLPIPLGTDGALQGLNPRDVQSIRVLKNASDTAMYGSRGANGVVLITTIRPDVEETDSGS